MTKGRLKVTVILIALSVVIVAGAITTACILLSKSAPDEHVHSYQISFEQLPSCTEKGAQIYTCQCGDSYSKILDPTGHHFDIFVSTEPSTCTVNGAEIWACVCGEILVIEYPVSDHTFDIFVSSQPSTCTVRGSEVWSCECGQTITIDLPLAEHEFNKLAYDENYHWTECSVCSAVQDGEKQAHSFGTARVEPNCLEEGLQQIYCSFCDYYVDENLDRLEHDLQFFEAKDATEYEDGNVDYWQCKRCFNFFSSDSCDQELTEDDIFIPKLTPEKVASLKELCDIAFDKHAERASEEFYTIALTVKSIRAKTMKLGDDSTEYQLTVLLPELYSEQTINEGDVIVLRGKVKANGSSIELSEVEILSVDDGNDDTFSICISTTGDDVFYFLFVSCGNRYDFVENVYYFNSVTLYDTLTISCMTFGYGVVRSITVNGKRYELQDGTLELTVTGDMIIEIEFAAS